MGRYHVRWRTKTSVLPREKIGGAATTGVVEVETVVEIAIGTAIVTATDATEAAPDASPGRAHETSAVRSDRLLGRIRIHLIGVRRRNPDATIVSDASARVAVAVVEH